MNNYYQIRKSQVREEAMDYFIKFAEKDHSYMECIEAWEYFNKLGKRYDLLKEFKENGII